MSEAMAKYSETTRGYIYAMLGSIVAGSVPTLAKFALMDNGPVVVTGVSFLFSGLVLLLYQPRRRPQPGSIKYLIFFGIVGAAILPITYTVGLNETSAVNASLLANAEVLFTTVIAFTAFGERLTRGQAVRGLLIVAGLIIVSTNLDLSNLTLFQGLAGNLLILVAILGWSVENNLIALATKRFDTSLLSKFRNIIGGVVATAAFIAVGLPFAFDGFDWLVLFLLGLALAGTTYLFIAAVKRLGAVRMLLVWSSSTVFGAVFALVFLGETISAAEAFGGALILLGVYVFHRGEGMPEAEPFIPPAGNLE